LKKNEWKKRKKWRKNIENERMEKKGKKRGRMEKNGDMKKEF
jgi:hypothetical protein